MSNINEIDEAIFDALSGGKKGLTEEERAMETLAKFGEPDDPLVDAINEFTRARLRENSFLHKILPPTAIV